MVQHDISTVKGYVKYLEDGIIKARDYCGVRTTYSHYGAYDKVKKMWVMNEFAELLKILPPVTDEIRDTPHGEE